ARRALQGAGAARPGRSRPRGGDVPAAEPAATGRATTAAVRHPLGGAARAGALARRARRGPRRYRRGARGRGGPVALDRAAVRPQPRIRVSPQSGDHLSRLISAASYVMSRDEVQLAELSEALGVSEKQLITDLQVLFVCGDMGAGWEDLIE